MLLGWSADWRYKTTRSRPIRKVRPPITPTRTKLNPQFSPSDFPRIPKLPPTTTTTFLFNKAWRKLRWTVMTALWPHTYAQPLSRGQAPEAMPAGPAFQPWRCLRSEPRPGAEVVGHVHALNDSSVPIGRPPPRIQPTHSSPLLVVGAASRIVEANPGPPVEPPQSLMSPLMVAGTAAPAADFETP